MKTTDTPEKDVDIPPESMTTFAVDSGGTLSAYKYDEPRTRSEIYDLWEDWENSGEALASLADDIQPLAWRVHSIYEECRDVLVVKLEEIGSDETPQLNEISRLRAVLAGMPEDPEAGANRWLGALDPKTYQEKVVAAVREWRDEEPDRAGESDYLPDFASAYGVAMSYFQALDGETLDLLGVEIIEGEHPGSTYYAAELRMPIDDANAAAASARLDVRFVRAQNS